MPRLSDGSKSEHIENYLSTCGMSVVSIRDRVTRNPVPGVLIDLETSIGTNQEDSTDGGGDIILEIPSQERVRIYLRKDGYVNQDQWIDLRYEKRTKYNYYIQRLEDVGNDEGVPSFDGGSSSLDLPDIGIGGGDESSALGEVPLVERGIEDLNPQINEAPDQSIESQNFGSSAAASKIDQWLSAKAKIFASPYDRSLAETLMIGEMLKDNLGSIDWLESFGWEYSYKESMLVRDTGGIPIHSESFVANYNEGTAAMIVRVQEDRTLYKNNREVCNKQSGKFVADFRYTFSRDNSNWKISDFCKIDQYENCISSETGC